MKLYRITFTEEEYHALSSIIENGWGNGDFSGYGGQDEKVQASAMNKFDAALPLPQAHPAPRRKQKPKSAADVALLLAKGNRRP